MTDHLLIIAAFTCLIGRTVAASVLPVPVSRANYPQRSATVAGCTSGQCPTLPPLPPASPIGYLSDGKDGEKSKGTHKWRPELRRRLRAFESVWVLSYPPDYEIKHIAFYVHRNTIFDVYTTKRDDKDKQIGKLSPSIFKSSDGTSHSVETWYRLVNRNQISYNLNIVDMKIQIKEHFRLSDDHLTLLVMNSTDNVVRIYDKIPVVRAQPELPSDSNEPTCGICRDPFEFSDVERARIEPCKHVFHLPCVIKWHGRCPFPYCQPISEYHVLDGPVKDASNPLRSNSDSDSDPNDNQNDRSPIRNVDSVVESQVNASTSVDRGEAHKTPKRSREHSRVRQNSMTTQVESSSTINHSTRNTTPARTRESSRARHDGITNRPESPMVVNNATRERTRERSRVRRDASVMRPQTPRRSNSRGSNQNNSNDDGRPNPMQQSATATPSRRNSRTTTKH